MQPSIDAVLAHAEVVVVGNGAPEFREAIERLRPGVAVVDLVRIDPARRSVAGQYEGICW
jgi:GDP-mannose 6-dehydrogenase